MSQTLTSAAAPGPGAPIPAPDGAPTAVTTAVRLPPAAEDASANNVSTSPDSPDADERARGDRGDRPSEHSPRTR